MNDIPRLAHLVSRRALIRRSGVALAVFLAGCGRGGTPSAVGLTSDPRVGVTLPERQVSAPAFASPSPASSSTTATVATPVAMSGPIVFIDPGHGGVDQGAVGVSTDGQPVNEKTVVLALAEQAAAKLRASGYQVVLSRTTDALPGLQTSDLTPDGTALTPQGVLNDLQRRIDLANASGAQVFLSIHLDANDDPSVRGTSTYYDSARAFAAENLRFALQVQQDLIAAFRAGGFTTPDLGVIDDTQLSGNSLGVLPDSYNHLVLLGPAVAGQLRPTHMPGALSEALFVSNSFEATAALDPVMQDLIAGAYADAVTHFLPLPS